jgi:phosphoglycolate phosphatase-like HAD superfamily hydrolase
MPRLVLWDVDHTLIDNAGVSKEIYAAAFQALTGDHARHLAQTEGRTDPEIMADLLRIHDAPYYAWASVQRALELAGANHHGPLAERGVVLPGVREIVAELAAADGVVQTVVTGNIRANAEVKLGALGLRSWFDLDVGGYGSDGDQRSRLVELAMTRAAAKCGVAYGRATTVVIGDTPRDIQAGSDNGIRVLAVATGDHSTAELRDAGADFVVSSLTDVSAVLRFVLAPVDEITGTP